MIGCVLVDALSSLDMCSTLDNPLDRTMNGVLVPFPAPGAPLSHTTSLGARSLDPRWVTTLRNTDSNSMAACGATSSCPGGAGVVAVAPTGAAANPRFHPWWPAGFSNHEDTFHSLVQRGRTLLHTDCHTPHRLDHVAHMMHAARSCRPSPKRSTTVHVGPIVLHRTRARGVFRLSVRRVSSDLTRVPSQRSTRRETNPSNGYVRCASVDR